MDLDQGISPKPRKRKRDQIELLINSSQLIVTSGLSQLRYLILVDGLTTNPETGMCSYRPYVWSIQLRVPPMKTKDYARLVSKGPSAVYSKIRNDTFRTLATDSKFMRIVSEDSLIRVLNSFAWKLESSKNHNISQHNSHKVISRKEGKALESIDEQTGNLSQYVQGMNVLLAPFLYACKSEVEGFAMFHTLLTRDCPLYVVPSLDGVHTGLKMLDICLKIIDPKLSDFLNSKLLKSELYAFASVLTLSACTPPLSEVLILWDFLFAYGTHLNILFIIAQLILIRNHLLQSKSPMSLLRAFPSLKSREIIKLGVSFIAKLPENVYDLLSRHMWDDSAHEEIMKLKI